MCGDGDDDDGDDDDDCWLPVITAPPAHLSLSSQRLMGHLSLTGATGTAGPMLTHLLITPPGHGGEKQSWEGAPPGSAQAGGSPDWLPIRHAAAARVSVLVTLCRPVGRLSG